MARALFEVERPTVGLLNVGVEEIKGQEEVKEAGRLLREANLDSLEYYGFVEGNDLGKGTVDVVVTEGFSGNIALKAAEGTARADRRLSARCDVAHAACQDRLSLRQERLRHAAREDGSEQASMAVCSSASTASSSRAMAALTLKASLPPSRSATTWPRMASIRK